MEKKIWLLILGYIISIVLLFLGTYLYIKQKDDKLRGQAYLLFNDFFQEQPRFIDTQYSNGRTRYAEEKPGITTNTPFPTLNKLHFLNEKNPDIYKFFRIDASSWQLFAAQRNLWKMITYYIY